MQSLATAVAALANAVNAVGPLQEIYNDMTI